MQKILFMTGSMNQTIQMQGIASHLPDFDCWFSQLFSDSKLLNNLLDRSSFLNATILAHRFRLASEEYLTNHGLQIDYKARLNQYDLVVYCSDMIMPESLRHCKSIWVQEGMIDKYTVKSQIVKKLNLPPYWCGDTSLNGSSNNCDVYCVASEGYKTYLTSKGTYAGKIVVTGMPNYDNLEQHLDNDFLYQGYVMVATTDMRETYRYENRPAFITKAVEIANGRQLLFKLHPNEDVTRATAEIMRFAPAGTLIYDSGNTNHMIANCCELITQYSTVVYTGIALGKKVHSWFDVDELKKLSPIQNGGASAGNIAQLCRAYAQHSGAKNDFNPQQVVWQKAPVAEDVYV
ncbi:hypothetical protein KHS38_10965 [Mucilaginibacter sp. Bleaf8]|uniref:hypothetical protein n=1 Tax=Mucilaginibacter sp. Bleaf8 TaxID=2834430 RepID=UPI001BCE9D11|nr:hypothetical protein [Mucilaginibacter sp. Bleaf8]MBS7564927.1 hypothetical protein [Mucilaginibacter sp. Bleaf8]